MRGTCIIIIFGSSFTGRKSDGGTDYGAEDVDGHNRGSKLVCAKMSPENTPITRKDSKQSIVNYLQLHDLSLTEVNDVNTNSIICTVLLLTRKQLD